MSLADAISELSANSIAPRNRVDILLEQWEGTPDGEALLAALHNPGVTSAVLTKAIRAETHTHSILKDGSVDAWRRKNAALEVNGL